MKAKMSLHRVLSELKTLDKRIDDSLMKLDVIAIKKGKEFLTPHNEEDFSNTAKSDMESVEALINRRFELKRALILANSSTFVEINGNKMTIAEAIDYKNVIDYKRKEYRRLKSLFSAANSKFETVNSENEDLLKKLLISSTSNDKQNTEAIRTLTETFNKSNKVSFVDPINIQAKMKSLENEINEFDTQIDSLLSEANAITQVEV